MSTRLPAFLETLERYDVDALQVFRAVQDYSDLATELVLEEEPQLEPFAFLQLSDQRDVVAGFAKLFREQSPHLLFEKSDDDEELDEDF